MSQAPPEQASKPTPHTAAQAQDQKDPQGAASESSEWPWWLDVVGLCKAALSDFVYLPVPRG